jgi:hypothetical protein
MASYFAFPVLSACQIYIFMNADERFLSVPELEKHIDFVTILLLGVFCYLCYFLKYSIL